MSAKKDKSQGFAFKIGETIYNFFQGGVEFEGTEEISDEGLQFEIEKILVDAAELLGTNAKDPRDVLDMLIEDLEYLRDNTKS